MVEAVGDVINYYFLQTYIPGCKDGIVSVVLANTLINTTR